jgi:hypothetical protein
LLAQLPFQRPDLLGQVMMTVVSDRTAAAQAAPRADERLDA